MHPDYDLEDYRRHKYLFDDPVHPRTPYWGRNWYSRDPYWWDDYYWGGRLSSRYGSRFRRHRRYGRGYWDDYDYGRYYDPNYYDGWNGYYKGKRDPNAKADDYGWWYALNHNKQKPPYYYDLPPSWVRYNSWNPYLWRRDQPPPFWMHGKDKKWHWEFKKEWERWYKGESKDWWNKFVPKDFKGKVEDLVDSKLKTLAEDLNHKERAMYDQIKLLKNTNREDTTKKERYLEEIQRLKNKIKDQELQEDLRHNYVYQILFENWKRKHKALAPYDRKSVELPDLQDDTRTRRDEWLEFDEENIRFPSPEEIDKMNLDIDFFDVDKFHDLNMERIKKLGKAEKPEDKRFKYDINVLDDKLFGKLDTERQNSENIEIKPMYASQGSRTSRYDNNNEYGEERKVYASTLK